MMTERHAHVKYHRNVLLIMKQLFIAGACTTECEQPNVSHVFMYVCMYVLHVT